MMEIAKATIQISYSQPERQTFLNTLKNRNATKVGRVGRNWIVLVIIALLGPDEMSSHTLLLPYRAAAKGATNYENSTVSALDSNPSRHVCLCSSYVCLATKAHHLHNIV